VHRDTFLIIKPTRCNDFSHLFLEWNSTCFRQFLYPSSGVFHCTHSNGICHKILLTACEQYALNPTRSNKLYQTQFQQTASVYWWPYFKRVHDTSYFVSPIEKRIINLWWFSKAHPKEWRNELYNKNQWNTRLSKLIFNFCCLLHVSNLLRSSSRRELYMQYGMFYMDWCEQSGG